MELSVLLVEDTLEDLEQFKRDLPEVFKKKGVTASIDPKSSFDLAYEAIQNPHLRYDMIITDTYRGDPRKSHDAAVLKMISDYREKRRFTPIVVYSSASQPAALKTSAFVNWADKAKPHDIDRAINETLDIGLPQIARDLHEDIDNAAGSFLWGFLEDNWERLKSGSSIQKEQLERIVRRRAAIKISDITPGSNVYKAVPTRFGLEYYIYPPLEKSHFSLGDVIVNKNSGNDIRVILTPHCHLFVGEAGGRPKADHVLTVKTVRAQDVLGEKLKHAKEGGDDNSKKLKQWARSPAFTERRPEGRHWYLPQFLEIPHLYCDFLQLESIDYAKLESGYKTIATLLPPYAEALQECFSSFYGSVGIPDIDTNSIRDLI